MRRSITVGFPHDGGDPVVLTGPEVPTQEHSAALKKLRIGRAHDQFSRIEVWTNDGASGVKFRTPEQQSPIEKAAEPAPVPEPAPEAKKKKKPSKEAN